MQFSTFSYHVFYLSVFYTILQSAVDSASLLLIDLFVVAMMILNFLEGVVFLNMMVLPMSLKSVFLTIPH